MTRTKQQHIWSNPSPIHSKVIPITCIAISFNIVHSQLGRSKTVGILFNLLRLKHSPFSPCFSPSLKWPKIDSEFELWIYLCCPFLSKDSLIVYPCNIHGSLVQDAIEIHLSQYSTPDTNCKVFLMGALRMLLGSIPCDNQCSWNGSCHLQYAIDDPLNALSWKHWTSRAPRVRRVYWTQLCDSLYIYWKRRGCSCIFPHLSIQLVSSLCSTSSWSVPLTSRTRRSTIPLSIRFNFLNCCKFLLFIQFVNSYHCVLLFIFKRVPCFNSFDYIITHDECLSLSFIKTKVLPYHQQGNPIEVAHHIRKKKSLFSIDWNKGIRKRRSLPEESFSITYQFQILVFLLCFNQ